MYGDTQLLGETRDGLTSGTVYSKTGLYTRYVSLESIPMARYFRHLFERSPPSVLPWQRVWHGRNLRAVLIVGGKASVESPGKAVELERHVDGLNLDRPRVGPL